MQATVGDTFDADSVLYVTGDAILGLDLGQALAAVGVPADRVELQHRRYGALIVDSDDGDCRQATIIGRFSRARVPVIVIADSAEIARAIGGEEAIWFPKPVCTDDLADCVGGLIRSQKGGCPPRSVSQSGSTTGNS